MIFLAWIIGISIGFASVFSGIYTTEFAKDTHWDNPKRCEFEVKEALMVINITHSEVFLDPSQTMCTVLSLVYSPSGCLLW